MKLVSSSMRSAGRPETAAAVLYGIGCACWFVASGRFFPTWHQQSEQRLLLLVGGSFFIFLVNVIDAITVAKRYTQDRKNTPQAGSTRPDGVVAALMTLASLGLLISSILAFTDETRNGRYRELYDASFFLVSGAVLNVVFNTSTTDSSVSNSRIQLLTNSMLALHTVGATFFTSGSLLHATMSAESCQSGFLIGSYFTFLASSLFLTSSFLNYFRTRDLVLATTAADPVARSGSAKKKKKSGIDKTDPSSLGGRSAGWFPFNGQPPANPKYDEESLEGEVRPQKKSSKSSKSARRPRE